MRGFYLKMLRNAQHFFRKSHPKSPWFVISISSHQHSHPCQADVAIKSMDGNTLLDRGPSRPRRPRRSTVFSQGCPGFSENGPKLGFSPHPLAFPILQSGYKFVYKATKIERSLYQWFAIKLLATISPYVMTWSTYLPLSIDIWRK